MGNHREAPTGAGAVVVYYDRFGNRESSLNTTKIDAPSHPGADTNEKRELRGHRRRWWEPKHPSGNAALLWAEPAPERHPGEFVRVINELANQWAASRDFSIKKPVERHLKLIGEGDHGVETAGLRPPFDLPDH